MSQNAAPVWPSLDRLTPIAAKSINEVQTRLQDGSVAFLIGAGVDIGLAGLPRWNELLNNLLRESPSPHPPVTDPQYAELAKEFPTEFAYLARWSMGDDRFFQQLAANLEPKRAIKHQDPLFQQLAALLPRSNLVVTLNYSSVVETVLKAGLPPEKKLLVHDREELTTFELPGPMPDFKEIHLVHLHGRCTDRSMPILDAWGYSIAREDSTEYMDFLRDLFARRTVITIGCSWSDVPLRDAAAFVKRKLLYANKNHLAILFGSRKPVYAELALRRAMRGAFGVEVLPVYDEESQNKALALINQDSQRPGETRNIAAIADFLDAAGDFDSKQQHRWLTDLGTRSNASVLHGIQQVLDELYKVLLDYYHADPIAHWKMVARVERHLRHHRFLYFGGHEDQGRKTLWSELARGASSEALGECDDRLAFDFLVGLYELQPDSPPGLDSLIAEIQKNPLLVRRFQLAREIWQPSGDNREQVNLRDKLLQVGWESIAAKVAGDSVAEKALRVDGQSKTPSEKARIADLADGAEGLARAAGSFWRHFKPAVLKAFWSFRPEIARLELLSKMNSAREAANPMLLSGLVAGLVVCELRINDLKRAGGPRISTEKLITMLEEVGLQHDYLGAAFNSYWDRYVPPEVIESFDARKQEYRRKFPGQIESGDS